MIFWSKISIFTRQLLKQNSVWINLILSEIKWSNLKADCIPSPIHSLVLLLKFYNKTIIAEFFYQNSSTKNLSFINKFRILKRFSLINIFWKVLYWKLCNKMFLALLFLVNVYFNIISLLPIDFRWSIFYIPNTCLDRKISIF